MNIFKRTLSLLLIINICFSIPLEDNTLEAKERKIKYNENSALALNYHRIRNDNYFDKFLSIFSNSKELSSYSITDTEFEKQIKWLKNHDAHFLTEKELLEYKDKGKFPKKSVWINFDDMDNSIYKNAHPILKKYNIPATGFVITGKVGSKDFHNLNMATKNELLEMKNSGLWTFSSHTNNLHNMNNDGNSEMISVSNNVLSSDIKKSNKYLENELGMVNHTVSYPYGQMRDSKIKALKKSNIKYGYALEERAITPDDNNYYLPRILINEDSFNKIVKKWEGFSSDD